MCDAQRKCVGVSDRSTQTLPKPGPKVTLNGAPAAPAGSGNIAPAGQILS